MSIDPDNTQGRPMTLNIYFAAPSAQWPEYDAPLHAAFARMGLDVTLSATCADPATVDYLIYAPGGPVTDFSPFTRAKAVLSLWAGVDSILGNPTLTIPLTRMVDDGLRDGMVEYVTGHVLRHHLGMDRYIGGSEWTPVIPPRARDRRVTVLGMGALGTACAQALTALRFDVAGWSRRAKDVPGVTTFHGADGLRDALERTEVLVLLLPLTQETDGILDAEKLGWLPEGTVIINPGRGALIDDAALLAALASGAVAHATLDVFRVEPLPRDHPYWAHPDVTVTPHIASETRPETAAEVIAENVRRGETGAPLLYLADRSAGY